MHYHWLRTRLGRILIATDEGSVRQVRFEGTTGMLLPGPDWVRGGGMVCLAVEQLRGYLRGRLHRFELPLAPEGTTFERLVWRELARIPYGETTTYGQLARRVRNPRAARAVGAAARKNPIAIIVPCHRVVGLDGSLTGYAAGLERKVALLALERRHAPAVSSAPWAATGPRPR